MCGCGASFMRSGIWNHQRRSDDARCKEHLHMPTHDSEPGRCDNERGEEDFYGTEDFEVDPRCDFFGDYEDYSPEEFGTEPEVDGYEENSDDDEESDKPSLEPERLPNPLISNSNDVEVSDGTTQRANRLRGGAEAELNNKPYVVKFGRGKAGAVYADQDFVDENTS
jgi:hypothetical protein